LVPHFPPLQFGADNSSLAFSVALSALQRPGDPCLGISGRTCHKGTSRSYTQRRETPGWNDSDSLAIPLAIPAAFTSLVFIVLTPGIYTTRGD